MSTTEPSVITETRPSLDNTYWAVTKLITVTIARRQQNININWITSSYWTVKKIRDIHAFQTIIVWCIGEVRPLLSSGEVDDPQSLCCQNPANTMHSCQTDTHNIMMIKNDYYIYYRVCLCTFNKGIWCCEWPQYTSVSILRYSAVPQHVYSNIEVALTFSTVHGVTCWIAKNWVSITVSNILK